VADRGNLTAQLLIRAYCRGLFPMAEHRHGPIRWCCPQQRAAIPLDHFHVPRRLQRRVRQSPFALQMDTVFADVIRACAEPRRASRETWINDQIINAYTALHAAGLAHSVEAWSTDPSHCTAARRPLLVGGIYGVALGGAFYGESMFSRVTDASKLCLVHLVEHLRQRGFVLFDVQYISSHLVQFGAQTMPRETFLNALAAALRLKVTW